MQTIRRCLIYNSAKSPSLSFLLSRRWLSHTRTLLDQDETSKITEEDQKRSKKSRINKLSDLVEIKSEKAPESQSIRKLSPLEFMNQGKSNIPKYWRKDKNIPEWKRQKFALTEKFKGEKWNPNRKLSREEMTSVRMLKHELPDMTAKEISQTFKVSPEAIRRILKSNWTPTLDEEEDMYDRWKRRGEKVKVLMTHKHGSVKKLRIVERDGAPPVPVIENHAPKRLVHNMDNLKDRADKLKKYEAFKRQNKSKKSEKRPQNLKDIMF